MGRSRRQAPRLTDAQRNVSVEVLRRVYALAEDVPARIAETDRERGVGRGVPSEGRFLQETVYQVFLIEGQRGVGKSTVLRYLQSAIPFLGSRARRPAGVDWPGSADDEESVLKPALDDGEFPKELLMQHSDPTGRDVHWGTALCLPALDPGRREPSESPMMEHILANIDNFLSERIPSPEALARPVEPEEWRLSPQIERRHSHTASNAANLRKVLREKVFRGWVLSQPTGQQVVSQDVAGSDDFVVARAEEAGKAAERHRTWHEFVDRFLSTYQSKLLALFFDDCDLTPDAIGSLLETVRLYLDHPRIVVLMAGNGEAIRNNLRITALERMAGIAPTFQSIIDYQDQLDRKIEGARQAALPIPAELGNHHPEHLIGTYLRLIENRLQESDRYASKLLRASFQLTIASPGLHEATEFVFAPFVAPKADAEQDRRGIDARVVARIREELSPNSPVKPTGRAQRTRFRIACDAFLWLLWRNDVSAGLSLRTLADVREHFEQGFRATSAEAARISLASILPKLIEDERADDNARRILAGEEPVEVRLLCESKGLGTGTLSDLSFTIEAERLTIHQERTSRSDSAAHRQRAYRLLMLDQARLENLTRRFGVEVALLLPGRPPTASQNVNASGILMAGQVRHPVEAIRDCATELQPMLRPARRADTDSASRCIDELLRRDYAQFSLSPPPPPPSNAYLMAVLADVALRAARLPPVPAFQMRPAIPASGNRTTDEAMDRDLSGPQFSNPSSPQIPDLSSLQLADLFAASAPGQPNWERASGAERFDRYRSLWSLIHDRAPPHAVQQQPIEAIDPDASASNPEFTAFVGDLDQAIGSLLTFRRRLVQGIDMALYAAGATLAAEAGGWSVSPEGRGRGQRVAWSHFAGPAVQGDETLAESMGILEERLTTVLGVFAERRSVTLHQALPLHLLAAVLLPLAQLKRLGVAGADSCLRTIARFWPPDPDWGLEPTIAVGEALLEVERDGVPREGARPSFADAVTNIQEALKLCEDITEAGVPTEGGRRLAEVAGLLRLKPALTTLVASRPQTTLGAYLQSDTPVGRVGRRLSPRRGGRE